MNYVIWIIVGAVIGFIATRIVHTSTPMGLALYIAVGIVGAFLAGLILTPLIGIGTINQGEFSTPSLIVSLLGAIILLAIANLFRRRKNA
jgi:uncharacterized membrane protein YeaQ/YmgE (transglycosylase-associated protein family)